MWDVERFTEDCAAVIAAEDYPQRAVRELLTRVVEKPGEVIAALGEPNRAGLHRLHVSPTLTILNLAWGPHMYLQPHNHNMWAVIGIYTGREDNILWKRVRDDPAGRIEAAGARAIGAGDVLPLGRDIIHSVTNPVGRVTGAIHIYGGDFFATPRSEWDPERLDERRFDAERLAAQFEASNRLLELGAA